MMTYSIQQPVTLSVADRELGVEVLGEEVVVVTRADVDAPNNSSRIPQ